MTSRGFGRGRRLFLQNEPEPVASAPKTGGSDEGSTEHRDSGIATHEALSTLPPRSMGRGRLAEQLRQMQPSTSASSSEETTASVLPPRGRAARIQSILKTEPSSSSNLSSTSGRGSSRGKFLEQLLQSDTATSSTQSKSEASSDISESITRKMSELQFKDKTMGLKETREVEQMEIPHIVEVEEEVEPVKKHGTSGRQYPVVCNYIRLKQADSRKGIYEYEVRFFPAIDSRSIRFQLLNAHSDKFGGAKSFDGVTLYLPIQLPDKLTTYKSKNPADDSDVDIKILFKRKKILKDCIHLYNLLFDRIMHTLNFVRFNRKQFDPTNPMIIPQHKLEVWPGFVTAVDEYEGGLMLCCDVSHRLLCQKTVLNMLEEIYAGNRHDYQENAKRALLGAVVLTRYNNRTYRIDDISFDLSPKSTFTMKTDRVSYLEYYKLHHGIEIKNKEQPLLISIKAQRVQNQAESTEMVFCLIPELSYLTGLRDDMRADMKLMRDIATHTRVTPNQRVLALEKFCRTVNGNEVARKILSDWGLQLQNSLETINARRLEDEQIFFANKQVPAGPQCDFGKFCTNAEQIDVVHLRNWLVLHCPSDNRAAKSFVELMERNSSPMGISVTRPTIVTLQNDRVETYVRALRQHIRPEVQIVVCICPTSRDDRYAAIKKMCCSEIPIPSQVINGRTLGNENKNRAIVQKIALQMNCKLGGTLWRLRIPIKGTMICGVDSFHDLQANSVAAFVASTNGDFTRWYSKAVIQNQREEIVNGLCVSLIAALKFYQNENNTLPEKIIIFRDGVGYGQFGVVTDFEIPQFDAACQKGFANYKPLITFVVVQKRINTRMFGMEGNGQINAPPGTVLDNTVTIRHLYDFFLVSQMVRQGTVTPTHYIVLRDDSQFSPDILQRLSYKMCFMYYNWPGTIRVPACCQYAHKLAFVIGKSVKRCHAEELSNKLFYL